MNEDASTKNIWLKGQPFEFHGRRMLKIREKNLQLYLTVYIKWSEKTHAEVVWFERQRYDK